MLQRLPGKVAPMSTFGERLVEAMGTEVDRKELAAALGVSYQAIRKVEIGETVALTAENCARAARFLKVDMFWLATGEGEMRVSQPTFSPWAIEVAEWFDSMKDRAKQERAYGIIHGMCVKDRWPGPAQNPPAPAPTPAHRKTHAK
jgi:transcriptional regulator with XRE-family HTH domain